MPIVTAIAVYFVIWWVCLFTVLPWGIRGQAEEHDVVEGSEPGAPVQARMKRKFMQNTVLSAIVFCIIYALVGLKIITWETFSFLPSIEVSYD